MSLRNRLPIRVAYVWAMVFIAMVIYSFAWFVNIWWLWSFIDAFEASMTLDVQQQQVVDLIKNVLAWHPIIAMFGWIVWGFLNSARRDPRTYEAYQ